MKFKHLVKGSGSIDFDHFFNYAQEQDCLVFLYSMDLGPTITLDNWQPYIT